jgi:hypothetical protein
MSGMSCEPSVESKGGMVCSFDGCSCIDEMKEGVVLVVIRRHMIVVVHMIVVSPDKTFGRTQPFNPTGIFHLPQATETNKNENVRRCC